MAGARLREPHFRTPWRQRDTAEQLPNFGERAKTARLNFQDKSSTFSAEKSDFVVF